MGDGAGARLSVSRQLSEAPTGERRDRLHRRRQAYERSCSRLGVRRGRIDIDTPWETAVKKMFYRPSAFKVRDAFDLAAVVDRHGLELRSHLIAVEDRLDKLIDRLDALAAAYERMDANDQSNSVGGEARDRRNRSVGDFASAGLVKRPASRCLMH